MTQTNKQIIDTLTQKSNTSIQQLAGSQAAIRHAMSALRLGKNVEAYAVLKANTENIHFSWDEVDRLVGLARNPKKT